MGVLVLIRHGQTELNAKKVYFGRLDPPLNDSGIKQIQETKKNILNIKYDNIYSSPLLRAKQSAEILNHLDLPILHSEELAEINLGLFEGLTYEEIAQKYPNEFKKSDKEWRTYNFETGESIEEMYNRVLKFLSTLDFSKNNLIVAHWGTINCILSHYLSSGVEAYWKYKLENGGIAILEGTFDFCYLTKFV